MSPASISKVQQHSHHHHVVPHIHLCRSIFVVMLSPAPPDDPCRINSFTAHCTHFMQYVLKPFPYFVTENLSLI